MSLSPPGTDIYFDIIKELISHCQSHARAHGYAISTKRSTPGRQIYLKWDLGGRYRDRKGLTAPEKQRITASRLIDCPFLLYGQKESSGINSGKWKLKVNNPLHNHGPTDIISHPAHRRLTAEQEASVLRLSNAGARPRTILSDILIGDPNAMVTTKTISNTKAKMRLQNLNGRTPIQALFEELGGDEW